MIYERTACNSQMLTTQSSYCCFCINNYFGYKYNAYVKLLILYIHKYNYYEVSLKGCTLKFSQYALYVRS